MNKEEKQKIIDYLVNEIVESHITHGLIPPGDTEVKFQAESKFTELSQEDKAKLLEKLKES